jgi:N-succinyldiaminopimelate aminotransferase
MTAKRLRGLKSIGVDKMGAAADRLKDGQLLRLENLDTDLPPPEGVTDAPKAQIGIDNANSVMMCVVQRRSVLHVGWSPRQAST